jgi:hypothetical protein
MRFKAARTLTSSRCTVGADKAYDTRDFITGIREINMTPHVAQDIDRRG